MTLTRLFGQYARVVGLTAFAATAQAASLSVGFQATIGSEQNDLATSEGGPYNLSVNPNNSGYAAFTADLPGTGDPADAFQRSFSGPVLGWSFVGGGPNNELTIAQESGELISYTTTDTVFDSFAQRQRQLWTTSDPGADLLNPATSADSGGPGYRSFGQIAASIDISGLRSGAVNIFYGSFRATPLVSVVMRDADGAAPDLNVADVHLNGDSANRAEYYVAEVDFVNDAGYDVIEYTYLANGVDDTDNGRFGGTVLTGAGGPPAPFNITDYIYSPGDNMVTLTWDSVEGEKYTVRYSRDLETWLGDLDDGIEAAVGETSTSGTFDLSEAGVEGEGRLFFRVEVE